jgi:hypothetical protein
MFRTAVSICGFMIMVAAILLLIQSRTLFGDTDVSIGLQIGAILLMVWPRVALGKRSFHVAGDPTDGTLVTSAPYRYLRHPIYAAGLCFIWAGVISHFAIENALIGLRQHDRGGHESVR